MHALPIHTDSEQFSIIKTSNSKPLSLAKKKLIAPSQHQLNTNPYKASTFNI